ncbi:hypothetical protein LACDD01_02259 [Lactococcus sp. DD01]|nr:hypothetical protein LACDD01_02259 [Lactococcus sp. DD01]
MVMLKCRLKIKSDKLFLMRKDILESLSLHFMNDTKSNFADLTRRYN